MEISLKEYIDELIRGLKQIEEERWQGHMKVHEMGQRAFDSAMNTLDARLEVMNDFRTQIAGERADFVSQQLYDTEHKALEERLERKTDSLDEKVTSRADNNAARIASLENYKSNMDGKLWMMGAVLTALTIGLNLAFMYFRGK